MLTTLLLFQPFAETASALDSGDAELVDSGTEITTTLDGTEDDIQIDLDTDTPEQPDESVDDVIVPDEEEPAEAPVEQPDKSDAATEPEAPDASTPDAPENDADTSTDTETETNTDTEPKIITGFAWAQRVQYTHSETLEDIDAELPQTMTATLSDGSNVELAAVWTLEEVDRAAFEKGTPYDFPLSYWMELPEGYTLDPSLDATYMPNLLVSLKYTSRGVADDVYGIATQAAVTVSSWEASSNMLVDTGGSTVSTRYYHKFDDDQKNVYCIAQGKANPDGKHEYYHDGTANGHIAAVIDMGYPACYDSSKGAYVINGVSLSADQARQATQFAVWCFTNDANRHTISPSTMKARKGTTGSDAAYTAGVWLYNYGNSHTSSSLYNIWRPYDTDYQAVVSTTNIYVPTGTLYVQKNSNTTAIATSGSYALSGATFGVYTDYACTNKIGEVVTGANGVSGGMTVSPGTYYARELCGPDNYALHAEAYGAVVTAGGTATIQAYDQPVTGTITLSKTSSNSSVSGGNSNYSLQGAIYYVYNSSGSHVATLTTDANGKASVSGLQVGTYTIKEMRASPGFKINSTTYTATITQNQVYTVQNGSFELSILYRKNGYLYGRVTSTSIRNYTGYRFATWVDDQSNIVWYDGADVGKNTYDFSTYLGRHSTGAGTLYIHVYGTKSDGSSEYVAGLGRAFDYSDPTVSLNVTDAPAPGYIQLTKTSSNPTLTNNNSNFSLQGAVYGVYTDSACTVRKTTMTTDANGKATSGALPIGTYYVKEITAPKGFKLDTAAHSVTVTQTTTPVVDYSQHGYEFSSRGYIYAEVRQIPSSYARVRMAVWSKSDQSDLIWYEAWKTGTTSSGVNWASIAYPQQHSGAATYNIHTYAYPNANSTSGGVYMRGASISFNYNDLTSSVSVTDDPAGGWVELQKASSMPDITNGNPCYSLKGAVYGVYSDRACKTQLCTLTTDANGYAKSGLINPGTVYIKEITAPEGYELDEQVYSVSVSSGLTVKLNVKDEPGNDPIGIQLTKIQKYPNQYIPSMEGAEFTVKYYAGQYATTADLPANATRTWVISTQKLIVNNQTIYMTLLADKYKVGGDPFYYSSDGSMVVVPIGTITIQETKAPEGYVLSGGFLNDISGGAVTDKDGVILLNITKDNQDNDIGIRGGNYYTQQEEFQLCSLTLNKKDNGGNALAGATFKLQILNPETNVYDDLTTGTTDENGQIKFTDLVFGKYRLIETATNGNASLMADPIDVTLPVTTEQDAGGTAPTYTIDGTNYYCDVTLTVQNGQIIVPHTGSRGALTTVAAGLCTLGVAAGMIVLFRRKRDTQ